MAQFGQIPYVGVILRSFSPEDLARTTTIAVRVHIHCAPVPSQAQDDPIMRWGTFKLSCYRITP